MSLPEQISKNFTLSRLTYSPTAKQKNISNYPSEEHYNNLKYLAENVIEKIHDKYPTVKINSCYRGSVLNKAIGGAKTSQHMVGQAVDLEVPGLSNKELANWIASNVPYDQLILEMHVPVDPNSGWVHVSIKKAGNRKQKLIITKTKKTILVKDKF